MRTVVTGGTGRVGDVSVRALVDAGHEVAVVDVAPPERELPRGATFAEASAADHDALLEVCAGADAIVHLAGITRPIDAPPHVVHDTNVVLSHNVLTVAAELGVCRVVMASSANAIGLTWSRDPVFDRFPLDEGHATRAEDAYSLSKWIGEVQADSVVRAHPRLSIASLRLHMFMADHAEATRWSGGEHTENARRGLWGYTTHRMWTGALLAALTADLVGHERFFVVADRNVLRAPARELAAAHFAGVPVSPSLTGDAGFFDCSRARDLLGWSGRDA